MLLNNKKFVIALLVLTIMAGAVFSFQKKKSENISEQEVAYFSQEFNKNLPVNIDKDTKLIKTQVGTISPYLFSLDFFYAYYLNKNDIKNFDIFTKNMIYQTCNNQITYSLLQRKLLIRHQFITLDKEKLPYIGVSIADCATGATK